MTSRTLTLICCCLTMIMSGCQNKTAPTLTGYIEAEYRYLAPQVAGTLKTLPHQEGDAVKSGDLLFGLDDAYYKLKVSEAQAKLEQAQATLADLQQGLRSDEIDALEAQLDEAKASQKLAASEQQRQQDLFAKNVASQSQLEQAETTYQAAKSRVSQLEANLRLAHKAARDEKIRAAEASRDAAAAQLQQAEWSLSQCQVLAPADGSIEQILIRPGEVASAGNPVVALLPATALKVRFFIPEARLPLLKLGDTVQVQQESLEQPVSAVIDHIASEAEFTPPVIYSKDSREKLVFLVEARLPANSGLHPGLPVDVELHD